MSVRLWKSLTLMVCLSVFFVCSHATDAAAPESETIETQQLYRVTTVREIQRLMLNTLPYALSQEIDALDRTNEEFKEKCDEIFAIYMLEDDENNAIENQELADWQKHTMLAAIWQDTEAAAQRMQACLPIAFKLLLDGLHTIYACTKNTLDDFFYENLDRAVSGNLFRFYGFCNSLESEKFSRVLTKKITDIMDSNFVDATIKCANTQVLEASVLTDVYQAIGTLALKLIPKTLYPALAQSDGPIDITCWQRYLSKVLYSTANRRTDYVLAKLHFNPAEFLASLTSTELVLKAINDLFTEIFALQTLASKHYQKIVDQIAAMAQCFNPSSEQECYRWLHQELDLDVILYSCYSSF